MKEYKLFCICGLIVGVVLLFYILSPYSPTCLLRSCTYKHYDGLADFLYAARSIKGNNYVMNYTKDNKSSVSVLVFVHIQKTAGTLVERRLVKDGLVGKTCHCFGRKRCNCQNPDGNTWLVSRYSTGWLCGLHADLTELNECIDNKLNKIDCRIVQRNYIYFTMLRDPINRFISEWLHIRRGATWQSATLRCHKQSPPLQHYKPCYFINENDMNSTIWSNVSLKSFIDCPYNLANNRQTRMLANLSNLNCYKHLTKWSQPLNITMITSMSSIHLTLLNSAKHNLINVIHCYGLSEYLIYSQYILQKCLHITFKRAFIEFNQIAYIKQRLLYTHATIIRTNLHQSILYDIENVNRLDIFLYNFAKQLFLYRLINYVLYDSNIPIHFKRPIHTLWHSYQFKSLNSLHYLLFSNLINGYNSTIINNNDNNSNGNNNIVSFSYRFNLFLTNLFFHKGTIPVSETVLINENNKWDNRLLYDFSD
uniref:Heparan-sulfate 6-O-sulfotransferase n=1 Tax=Schistosoma japonicum TaxID=6182 RepID=C1LFD7_SCHJA|nr:heparan sulfate 6-O-sulfotransferase 1a [Schistosoma japonicum]